MDGKYEMKIGTTFATVEEGVAELKRMIQKSRRIRVSNIPMSLLEELKPLLKDKDLMIILPMMKSQLKSWKSWRRRRPRKREYTLTTKAKKQTRGQ